MPASVGSLIGGRFEVQHKLGGSMGEILVCHDRVLECPVALKTFRHEFLANPDFLMRFNEEIAAWLRLGLHPNIVQCLSVFTINSMPYLVLEFISETPGHGHNLRDWLHKGVLSIRTAMDIAIDLCRALVHAVHVLPGFVHRDLKPENVLIEDGSNTLLTDFGVAHLSHLAEPSKPAPSKGHLDTSVSEGMTGTPAYMAPEQWRGDPLDSRTDIYALGCILFEMVTGRRPFAASSIDGLREQHLFGAIPPLPTSVPPQLQTIIANCVAKDPHARPADPLALLEELQACYQALFHEHPKPLASLPSPSPLSYAIRGVGFSTIGKHDEALMEFDRALASDPSLAGVWGDRGRLLFLMGRRDEAMRDFDEALRLDPGQSLALFYKAVATAASGDTQVAVELMSRAIELRNEKPGLAEFYSNRSAFHRDLGNREAMIRDIRAALDLDQDLSHAHYMLAIWHLDGKDKVAALPELNKAIELDPRNAKALIARGWINDDIGQYTAARRDYEMAAKIDPSLLPLRPSEPTQNKPPWQERLNELDRRENASPRAEELIERGTLLGKSGRWGESLAVFDLAIERFPTSNEAWTDRGRVHSVLGMIPEAIRDYEKGISLCANNPIAWYNLGNLFLRKKEFEKAISYFDKAISLRPDYAQAFSNRSLCWIRLDQLVAAQRDARRAARLSPLLPQPHYNLGIIEVLMHKVPEARKHLTKAKQLGSTQAARMLPNLEYAARFGFTWEDDLTF